MKCRFEFYPFHSSSTMYGGGYAVTACRCVAHNFDMGQTPMTATTLCPIGMIEDARDEALERIRNERG